MAATIGNKFWEARSTHGAKPKFEDADSLWKACQEYFVWNQENPLLEEKIFHNSGDITRTNVSKMRAMTIGALTIFLDITTETWTQYRKRKDLSDTTMRVDEIIRVQKFQGASADMLNPNIIARDLGLADKKELTGEGGLAIKTESTIFNFIPVDSSKPDS